MRRPLSTRCLTRRCSGPGARGARAPPLTATIAALEFEGGDELLKHAVPMASTVLDTPLDYLGPKSLIITDLTADNCVPFTASDAYLRDFHLFVPADCVASIRAEHNQAALAHMQRVLEADIRPSTELDLAAAARRGES